MIGYRGHLEKEIAKSKRYAVFVSNGLIWIYPSAIDGASEEWLRKRNRGS